MLLDLMLHLCMVLQIYSTIDQMPLCIVAESVCYGWMQRSHHAVWMPIENQNSFSCVKITAKQMNELILTYTVRPVEWARNQYTIWSCAID